MVQTHDGSLRSVMEKADTLLASVHYPSIRDKMTRLKKDYAELCNTATVRTCPHILVVWMYKTENKCSSNAEDLVKVRVTFSTIDYMYLYL